MKHLASLLHRLPPSLQARWGWGKRDEMRIIELSPGDVVVFRLMGRLSREAQCNLRESWDESIGIKAVVLEEGISIEKLAREQLESLTEQATGTG